MRFLSAESRAKRKIRRRESRIRTLASIKYVIGELVSVSDQLFHEDGKGAERKAWVLDEVDKHVRCPAGDKIDINIAEYLIELAVDEL
jgi:hypothetical protein